MTEARLGLTTAGVRLCIDVGGTFTDLVAYDEASGEGAFLKVHTTPGDPSEGILQAFKRYQAEFGPRAVTELSHATTIATNILIEKKGAKTCLLTTKGFEDVLEIRRHNRPQMYDLFQQISPPLVPRGHRIGIRERLDARGHVLVELDEADLHDAIEGIREQEILSVAVCFLHAYANPVHERKVMEALLKWTPKVYVSCSHEVWPEFREYERTSTTVLNAYIRPSVDHYLSGMVSSFSKEPVETFSVMKSNGGLTSMENARRYPVHLIESGPAAGMVSSAWLGKETGFENVITLDVGGTTAKAGIIINGTPKATVEFHADALCNGVPVGGYAIRSPVIDLMEIGSGGGSIAWIDNAGILKVGPRSAGAVPGPACYGLGGSEPTVTDANLVLGYLNEEFFHGGLTRLHRDMAEKVIHERIASYYDWSVEKAAAAITTIAKSNLTEMVRLVSAQKGVDPRDFSLLAYGGAGPLHASFIARELNIPQTIIPPLAGVFSALGLMVAGVRHDLVRTRPYMTDEIPLSAGPGLFGEMNRQITELLEMEGRDLSRVSRFRSVDMRYLGQVFELNLPIEGELGSPGEIRALERQFEEQYRVSFHYILPGSRMEIVNFRLMATMEGARPAVQRFLQNPMRKGSTRKTGSTRRVFDEKRQRFMDIPALRNAWLNKGDEIRGPAIIDSEDTTIHLLEDQVGQIDERGCLIIASG
jgi:N-methylhydantoinase A